MMELNKSLVRLQIGYYVHFWSPYDRKDVIKLERVWSRFISMLRGMECFMSRGLGGGLVEV